MKLFQKYYHNFNDSIKSGSGTSEYIYEAITIKKFETGDEGSGRPQGSNTTEVRSVRAKNTAVISNLSTFIRVGECVKTLRSKMSKLSAHSKLNAEGSVSS